jgi:uncharacterized protein HemY
MTLTRIGPPVDNKPTAEMNRDMIGRPIDLLLLAADEAEASGDEELRYDYLRLATLQEPNNDTVRYQFGRQCVRTRRYKEGIEHLRFSLDATGAHPPTIGFLMECYFGLGHPRKALLIAAKFPDSLSHTKVKEMYIKSHFALGHFRKLANEFRNDPTLENKASRDLIAQVMNRPKLK